MARAPETASAPDAIVNYVILSFSHWLQRPTKLFKKTTNVRKRFDDATWVELSQSFNDMPWVQKIGADNLSRRDFEPLKTIGDVADKISEKAGSQKTSKLRGREFKFVKLLPSQ
jgi:hypothetical protein